MTDNEFSYCVEFSRRGDRMVADVTGQTQIRLDECGLASALFHRIPSRAGDLLRIALAVYAVDRLSGRQRGQQSGGSRVMNLEVGVVEPDFWSAEETLGPLQEALELLGGDTWYLRFCYRRADTDYNLGFPPVLRPRVCLYSGGLDSAAGLATQLRTRKDAMLAVTTYHQGLQGQRVIQHLRQLSLRYGVDVRPIVVRTTFGRPPQLRKQELTQRCRSFLFAAMGGAVACAERSSSVEVYESGVGAINLPPMQGMGTGARMTKSSHPRFLRLMSGLLSQAAGRRVDLLLPHQDRTKGEIVRTLAEDGLADLAHSTVSCVHYPVRGKAKQCGYCPACIGRRQAMIVADIKEPDGAYEYDLFGAPRTTNGIEPAKLEYLKATLMHVDDLGELRDGYLPEWFLRYALGTGVAKERAGLMGWMDVLRRYRDEWLDLVSHGRSRGWHWAHLLVDGVAARERGQPCKLTHPILA